VSSLAKVLSLTGRAKTSVWKVKGAEFLKNLRKASKNTLKHGYNRG